MNDDMPNFIMYAIVYNEYVIDCGFGNNEECKAAMSDKVYSSKDGYTFIPMTLDNSPAAIGMFYNGNTFEWRNNANIR